MTGARKTHWFIITVIVLIVCGIIGTVLAFVRFNNDSSRTSATAEIEFSFDGAADGIAPNGNRFDISGILTDEVLNEALSAAGMDGRYTAEQIRPQIIITGVYPENIQKQMMNYESVLDFSANRQLTVSQYHATQYTVSLYNGFDPKISKDDLVNLLKAIMSAYRGYFSKEYAMVTGNIDNLFKLEDYDYPQQLQILTQMIRESASYANEMYKREPKLKDHGYAFSDIAVRLNNLIGGDISNLSAEITMNALTKNTKRLITQYQYEILTLNHQLEKQKKRQERVEGLLASYEKNEVIYLPTSDNLTKLDGNSSETYDKLVTERKSIADEITTITAQIAEYQLMLEDLLKVDKGTATAPTAVQQDGEGTAAEEEPAVSEGSEASEEPAISETDLLSEESEKQSALSEINNQEQIAKLEKDIAALEEKRVAIMKDFENLLNVYNEQEINDKTVSIVRYGYSKPKILSGTFAKQVIKTAGPFCAVGFMVCLVLMVISRRKEDKAKA